LNQPEASGYVATDDKYKSKERQSLDAFILDFQVFTHVIEDFPLLLYKF